MVDKPPTSCNRRTRQKKMEKEGVHRQSDSHKMSSHRCEGVITMKTFLRFGHVVAIGLIVLLCVSGCGIGSEVDSIKETIKTLQDPNERGLCWLALAVVIHGILGLFK